MVYSIHIVLTLGATELVLGFRNFRYAEDRVLMVEFNAREIPYPCRGFLSGLCHYVERAPEISALPNMTAFGLYFKTLFYKISPCLLLIYRVARKTS